ncbi:lysylphosphatidylglycerol synthase domain-containing protein [Ethanoligenens harbinense]|uniref:lysylphosphatidylglycerol synthase domain-containing protein n=1 Tax=Ethanoligenens harbinense TaxID=253239 RepID=UPI001586C199|nr:lysylphosphatidylglycerol synthase domain-containing protein [Ethanoligenens harbinense]
MKIKISLKSKWMRWIGIGITAVSFVFLAKFLFSMHVDLFRLQHPALTVLLVVALAVCYVGVVYLSAAAWRLALNFISQTKIPFHDVFDIYVRANIAKYLPGNVMHFAGRNMLAQKLSFDQVDVAFSTVLEVAALLVTAVIWSAVLSFQSFLSMITDLSRKSGMYLYIVIGVLILLVAAACLILRKKGLLKKYRRFFTPAFARLLPKLFLLYSLTMMIPGGVLSVFLGALGVSLTPTLLLNVIASYMISWVAGYVVIGSPGGIGVRESVMVLLLGPFCGNDIALLAALLLRVASAFGDGAAYALQQIWNNARRHKSASDCEK